MDTYGRYSRRWKDNIKMDFRELGYEFVNLSNLAQDRGQWPYLVNTVTKILVVWGLMPRSVRRSDVFK